MAEERRHNPRLGDQVREEDFVGYMNNLGLPHPNRMDEAVPANLQCGKPRVGTSFPGPPEWGPVIRTFAGVWQIEPEWVFVCPAGARSAVAATIFEKEGFERVANLRGGILEWWSIGLPVE